jgi:glycosyltransferase involved in cell wall biosynthesis
MKLSIIIPVYNEENTIAEVIKKVEEISLPLEKEVIVVDDASNDKTKEILNQLKSQFNFFLKEHRENKGKGAAIKSGLSLAGGDFVIIQDADLEYNPDDYPLLLEPLMKGEADVVYGSRNIIKNPFFNKLYFWGGQFLTFILNLLYGAKLTDINTGYKAFKKEVLEKLDLKEKGFAFCEEVTCKLIKKRYKIVEVPIHYQPRGFKEGKKIRWWRDGPRALYVIFKNRLL